MLAAACRSRAPTALARPSATVDIRRGGGVSHWLQADRREGSARRPWARGDSRGEMVKVAVLDSGIDGNHVAIAVSVVTSRY